MRTTLSLLFSGLNSPSFQPFLVGEMLQSLHHLHGPLLDSLQRAPISCTGVPRTDTVLLHTAQDTISHVSHKATLLAHVSAPVTQDCSAKPLCSWAPPSRYWCWGLFLPRCRTLHLSLLNFVKFLSVHFSSLLRSFWLAA